MIAILNFETVVNDNGTFRTAQIWITNGVTPLVYTKGSLTNEGDLQAILEAQEATLYVEAQGGGRPPTPAEQAKADRLVWLAANPNAKLIFTTTSAELETAINAMVDNIVVGTASAANKTRLKRLLMAGALLDREQVVG